MIVDTFAQNVALIPEAEAYYTAMAAQGRLIILAEAGQDVGLVTFYLCQSVEEAALVHTRPLWQVYSDSRKGRVIYLDKLLAVRWSLKATHSLERYFTQAVPRWHTAVWYRPTAGDDRQYILRRRDAAWPRR